MKAVILCRSIFFMDFFLGGEFGTSLVLYQPYDDDRNSCRTNTEWKGNSGTWGCGNFCDKCGNFFGLGS